MTNASEGSLWTIYFIVFMDFLNFGMIFPLLSSMARSFHASAAMLGGTLLRHCPSASPTKFGKLEKTQILVQASDGTVGGQSCKATGDTKYFAEFSLSVLGCVGMVVGVVVVGPFGKGAQTPYRVLC